MPPAPHLRPMNDRRRSRAQITREITRKAIQGLHEAGQEITREVLHRATGHKLVLLDEHLKTFIDSEESLRRTSNGIFEVMPEQPPTRAVGISVAQLGGMVTLRAGDQSLALSHREACLMGLHLAGFARRTPGQISLDEALVDASH